MTTPGKSTMRRDLSLMIGLPLALIITWVVVQIRAGGFEETIDIVVLERQLTEEFKVERAKVTLADRGSMRIVLVETGSVTLDSLRRADRAKAIARYAATNWQRAPRPDTMKVIFLTSSGLGGLTVKLAGPVYAFPVTEFLPGPKSGKAVLPIH